MFAIVVTGVFDQGGAFALFGGSIAGFFTDEPGVIRVAKSLFVIAAVFQTLDAVNVILRGSLRGAKDVRWVAAVGSRGYIRLRRR